MPFVISGLNVPRSPRLLMPYSDIIQGMLVTYKDPMSSVSLKNTKHWKENRLQDLRYSHYIVTFSDNSLFVSRPRYYVLLFMLLCSSRSACTVVCMRLSFVLNNYSWSADALEALTLMSASELFVMTEEVGSHWNSKVTNGEQPIMHITMLDKNESKRVRWSSPCLMTRGNWSNKKFYRPLLGCMIKDIVKQMEVL